MLQTRVIPCLLLHGESLVKTVRFRSLDYIGDPINTVRIFNELEVDELILLDIEAPRLSNGPNFEFLSQITNECFMPLAYGGGVSSLEDMKRLFGLGFEKVALNTAAFSNPKLITEAASLFGSQSIIGSIDVRRNFFGRYAAFSKAGDVKMEKSPIDWAKQLAELGAGELLLTSIDMEGTWNGYDLALLKSVTSAVNVPVIANGGAGSLAHIRQAVCEAGASAVALGSMVVYQAKGLGVLVNFPDKTLLKSALDDSTLDCEQPA